MDKRLVEFEVFIFQLQGYHNVISNYFNILNSNA